MPEYPDGTRGFPGLPESRAGEIPGPPPAAGPDHRSNWKVVPPFHPESEFSRGSQNRAVLRTAAKHKDTIIFPFDQGIAVNLNPNTRCGRTTACPRPEGRR